MMTARWLSTVRWLLPRSAGVSAHSGYDRCRGSTWQAHTCPTDRRATALLIPVTKEYGYAARVRALAIDHAALTEHRTYFMSEKSRP
jgi:hypothetical protein